MDTDLNQDRGRDYLRKLFITMLDDDHGISEQVWEIIQEPLYMIDCAAWKEVEATDGRFYLTSPIGLVAKNA
jgi:hypothetical protein